MEKTWGIGKRVAGTLAGLNFLFFSRSLIIRRLPHVDYVWRVVALGAYRVPDDVNSRVEETARPLSRRSRAPRG